MILISSAKDSWCIWFTGRSRTSQMPRPLLATKLVSRRKTLSITLSCHTYSSDKSSLICCFTMVTLCILYLQQVNNPHFLNFLNVFRMMNTRMISLRLVLQSNLSWLNFVFDKRLAFKTQILHLWIKVQMNNTATSFECRIQLKMKKRCHLALQPLTLPVSLWCAR